VQGAERGGGAEVFIQTSVVYWALHASIKQVGRGKTTSCLRIQKEWLRQILKTSVCGRHTLPLAANCVAKGGQCVLPFWWTRHSSATCVASCCTPLGKININHPGNYPSELIQRQSDRLRNLLSEGKHFAQADLQSATLFVCLYFWAVSVSKMISLFTEKAHTIEYSSNYKPTLRASRHYSRFVLGRFQVQISAYTHAILIEDFLAFPQPFQANSVTTTSFHHHQLHGRP
jgi:hypothetical protein